MGPQAAMSNLQIYFRLHLCRLRLLPFPLDYNFRISSRLSNFMFSTSIHTFWTSRFICFGLRFLYIRLRIRIIRLRLQKQSTSIEILLFVFLSATERHSSIWHGRTDRSCFEVVRGGECLRTCWDFDSSKCTEAFTLDHSIANGQ